MSPAAAAECRRWLRANTYAHHQQWQQWDTHQTHPSPPLVVLCLRKFVSYISMYDAATRLIIFTRLINSLRRVQFTMPNVLLVHLVPAAVYYAFKSDRVWTEKYINFLCAISNKNCSFVFARFSFAVAHMPGLDCGSSHCRWLLLVAYECNNMILG